MNPTKSFSLLLAAAALGLAACSDTTTPAIVSDAVVTADVVATSGEAIAADVGDLLGNELSVGLALPVAGGFNLFANPPGRNVTRTRTCFDAQNVAQTACDPVTTASIQFTVTVDDNVTRTNTGPRGSESMNIAIHRSRQMTISGLAGQETSRTHNGFGASHDTTTFTGTKDGLTLTRIMTEASADSVQSVVFNLPHTSNPWPVSGMIVRNTAGSVDVTLGDRHETHSFTRRVTVTFPADAQGNVTITINAKTCQLNLVTHAVTGCSP
jgi:hypothetical protein